jgi:hypothetical protein
MTFITMSKKEIDRYDVICRIIRRELTAQKAGDLLGLSKRQIKRLKKRVKKKGVKGLIHGNRGATGHNRVPAHERSKIVKLLKKKYPDFGPTFASEKLNEHHKIDRDPKTIRSIQIAEGLWTPRKGKKREEHREWRKRKDALGEMLQFDGSYHDWFEGRGETNEQCLLATIDDATGSVIQASFAEHEGVLPVMGFWKGYVLAYGLPRAIYLDKFSTYKVNHKIASENPDVKTQFQRACNSLGIQLIVANSPQAKGRVERLFDTLQDRLVKELRLAGISNTADANAFLVSYLPKFNARFSVQPASKANLHKPLKGEEKKDLDSILSRQTPRIMQNDFTFSFNNQWFQMTATQSVAVRRKDVVIVEEHTDGIIDVHLRGKKLNYKILPSRPKKQAALPWVLAPKSTALTPPQNHPWRLRMNAEFERRNLSKAKQRILIHHRGDSFTSRKE